jgi:hypothetical protein
MNSILNISSHQSQQEDGSIQSNDGINESWMNHIVDPIKYFLLIIIITNKILN